MPSSSPKKNRARYSDPSNASLTPVMGSFLKSSTASSRAQSLSPRKRGSNQPLHIRMNLTEMQMDRITDAFTKKVDDSPRKARQSNESRRQSPVRTKQHDHLGHSNTGSEDSTENGRFSHSTTFSELMPRHFAESVEHNIAERRQKMTPAPIEVDGHRRLPKTTPQRVQMEPVSSVVSPLSPGEMYSASTYTFDRHPSARPDALRPTINRVPQHPVLLEEYPSDDRAGYARAYMTRSQGPGHVESESRVSQQSRSMEEARQNPQASHLASLLSLGEVGEVVETPMFSPLALYFRGSNFPSKKIGEKTMIGEKGWLERTDLEPEGVKRGTAKRLGILEGIKKIAKDMTELHNPNRRNQHAAKDTTTNQLAISLNSREQSLLYGELEFHLTNALNTYITAQLEKGRLVTDKLKRITDAWLQLGRTRVVGFRYDLETQLELVSLHMDDFVFTGRRQCNPSEISGLLHAMKTNARSMRVRTFCQPDTVIVKQILDAQSLFNMIGVGRAEDMALAEIAQFFRFVVERERDRVEKESTKARKSRG